MSRYIFDLESDDFLDGLTKIHSLVLKDIDTKEVLSCAVDHNGEDPSGKYSAIDVGLHRLEDAELIVGHNVIGFDIPAITKVYPRFKTKAVVRDTLVLSLLLYPNLSDQDIRAMKLDKLDLPRNLIGSHSLEAWGYRLGFQKLDYTGGWESWSPVMQTYCEGDVEVTRRLLKLFERKQCAERAIELEHNVRTIVSRQERHGFLFDKDKAHALTQVLQKRRVELNLELQDAFPPEVVETEFMPKVNNKSRGYVKGVMFIKKNTVIFNPGSRMQIEARLKRKYKWKPKEMTASGRAKIDETILKALGYDETSILAEFFLVEKRLGQVSEGKEAWLNHVYPDSRIRGRVFTNGAITGRMTHSKPNIAQTPTNNKPYGKECRAMFHVPPGFKLVGCDADGLELRCLAGFMARYDKGDYIKIVLEGNKTLGTDMHSINCIALGLDPKIYRDIAKTWFYAFIYGAGDYKLGTILPNTEGLTSGEITTLGTASRASFLSNLPALGTLTNRVKSKSKKQGYITGLDGRRLPVRHEHASLNTALQSAGAIFMKEGLVVLDDLARGIDFEFVANIHDEWQMECREDVAETLGKTAVKAIEIAAENFDFPCPITGNYVVGNNWSETH